MSLTATRPADAVPTVPEPEPRGYAGNLGLLFAAHAQSERTAIVDLHVAGKPREISYRALDAMCNAVARGLARAGLGPGDRIGILSLNRVEFVAAFLGAMRAGVVPVPVNIKLAADTIAFILGDAGAKLVFAEPALRKLCPAGLRVVEFGGDGDDAYERFVDPGPSRHSSPRPTRSRCNPTLRAPPAARKACCSRITARTGAAAFWHGRAAPPRAT